MNWKIAKQILVITCTASMLAACGAEETSAKDRCVVIDKWIFIGNTALESARVGNYYAQKMEVADGQEPFTWILNAPPEYAWLQIDGATGVLHGTPTEPIDASSANAGGAHAIVIEVRDACELRTVKSYSLSVLP